MSQYVVLDNERDNNKILPILKNDISTFFCKGFLIFNDLHLSPFRIIHIHTLKYLTRGKDEAKILSGASLKILYFCTRSQNGWLAHCKYGNASRAVSESPVWPHVSNHIFLYKFMRTRVGSPFTDIENAP